MDAQDDLSLLLCIYFLTAFGLLVAVRGRRVLCIQQVGERGFFFYLYRFSSVILFSP